MTARLGFGPKLFWCFCILGAKVLSGFRGFLGLQFRLLAFNVLRLFALAWHEAAQVKSVFQSTCGRARQDVNASGRTSLHITTCSAMYTLLGYSFVLSFLGAGLKDLERSCMKQDPSSYYGEDFSSAEWS